MKIDEFNEWLPMSVDLAIEVLKDHNRDICYGTSYTESAIKIAIKALEAQRWIPVSERLPKKDKIVFVFTDCGETDFAYIGYTTGHWFTNGMLLIQTVTHWMPLPEPPETTREEAGHWDGIAPEQEV